MSDRPMRSVKNFSFYLVAISTSLSLGNFWRFPYVVGENGGGAVVLFYIILSFVLGMPLLMAEMLLGHVIKKRLMEFYKGPWVFLPIFLGFFVLSYYSVISGWVLYFLTQFTVLNLKSQDVLPTGINVLLKEGWLQWML